MSEFADLVRESLSSGALDRFGARVRRQAESLIDEIERGELDNPGFAIGLELETYAVDAEGRLSPLPDSVFEMCNKELGLHNAEINSPPSPFDATGLTEQAESISQGVSAARAGFREEGLELVLDAMWTIPPAEGTGPYLRATDADNGITIAQNMRRSTRYCALDNDILSRRNGAIDLDLPGFTGSFPSILPESLTTSIQPHLQIPTTAEFPRYYNIAIRTMAPILAISTNSPLLPADLYTAVEDPARLLRETFHELRIPVFEQSINAGDAKVRFPGDIESASDIVRRIAGDAVRAPFLREWVEDDDPAGFRDGFWELDHQRGMYWRWLRGIPGGQPVGNGTERSLRIEYRPLPTQPSVRDTVGLQWLTVGLIRGLVELDHPLGDVDWEAARTSFYDVVERGLDADIVWMTRDGERTTDQSAIYPELFEVAREGLETTGIAPETLDSYLEPIEARWEARTTPSQWKLDTVSRYLDDGAPLDTAIIEMQRDYLEHTRSETPFAEWA